MKLVKFEIIQAYTDDVHRNVTYQTNITVWDELSKIISWELAFMQAWIYNEPG